MTAIIAILSLVACHKQAPVEPTIAAEITQSKDPHSDEAHQAAVQEMVANFQRVHFEFDSATLTKASKDALSANATILQAHPRMSIQVEGHADERGTTDYNLALGQKRAQAVKEHLALLGVSSDRVKLVSMGEEKPLVGGHNETAWSQNRRCEFRILVADKGAPVQGTTATL